MEVQYTLLPEDIVAVQRFHAARRWKGKMPPFWVWLVVLGCVIVSMVLYRPTNHSRHEQGSDSSILGGWAVLLGLVLPPAGIAFLLWRLRNGPLGVRRSYQNGLYGKDLASNQQHFRLTPEGLEHSSANGNGLLRWSGIAEVVCADSHGFIYTTPLVALAIPCRAFASEAAFQDFMATAQRYHELATVAVAG